MNPPPSIAAGGSARQVTDCWNKIGVWGDRTCGKLEEVVHCRNCPVYSSAASQLLDEELPEGYLSQWTEYFAREKTATNAGTTSALVFRIGPEWLALSPGIFQEVADLRPIHSLPHQRGNLVLGLANIRGELLICVSLSEILGLEKIQPVKSAGRRTIYPRLLVTNREGVRFVFPIDEVHGIQRFKPSEVQEVPATVARSRATYTRGILKWEEKSVGWLDDQLLFYTLNRSLS
jgi:chemotaxis-related protein WspD